MNGTDSHPFFPFLVRTRPPPNASLFFPFPCAPPKGCILRFPRSSTSFDASPITNSSPCLIFVLLFPPFSERRKRLNFVEPPLRLPKNHSCSSPSRSSSSSFSLSSPPPPQKKNIPPPFFSSVLGFGMEIRICLKRYSRNARSSTNQVPFSSPQLCNHFPLFPLQIACRRDFPGER